MYIQRRPGPLDVPYEPRPDFPAPRGEGRRAGHSLLKRPPGIRRMYMHECIYIYICTLSFIYTEHTHVCMYTYIYTHIQNVHKYMHIMLAPRCTYVLSLVCCMEASKACMLSAPHDGPTNFVCYINLTVCFSEFYPSNPYVRRFSLFFPKAPRRVLWKPSPPFFS